MEESINDFLHILIQAPLHTIEIMVLVQVLTILMVQDLAHMVQAVTKTLMVLATDQLLTIPTAHGVLPQKRNQSGN